MIADKAALIADKAARLRTRLRLIADKAAVKDLVQQIAPVLKALGNLRKLIMMPLARYWVAPCCGDPTHTVNYHTVGFLPRLGDAIASLRDSIRDAFFVKKVPNFWVLCPNRMIGVGQRRQEPTDEEAAKAAALWGSDPVHPTSAAYRLIAESLEEDLRDDDARYTNPTRAVQIKKKPRYDPSLDREGWVSGCSAQDATLANRQHHVDGHRQGVAGRPRTGVSVPTTVAARREDLTTGPTVGAASGNSPVEGEEEAFKVTANGPLNIVYLVM